MHCTFRYGAVHDGLITTMNLHGFLHVTRVPWPVIGGGFRTLFCSGLVRNQDRHDGTVPEVLTGFRKNRKIPCRDARHHVPWFIHGDKYRTSTW